MHTVYIHTNNKQLFGAILSKYSFEKRCSEDRNFNVEIINVDEREEFRKLFNNPILMNGKKINYSESDLQSFTLARFMPPELSNYSGKSFIIDPDIFCISEKFSRIFYKEFTYPIAAVKHKGRFLSSAMLLENQKLKHWKIEEIIQDLLMMKKDYRYFMNLDFESGNIGQINDAYNHLDMLNDETILLHNTNRMTQPWKTGLKIDFRREKMKPVLGIIPREFIHLALGKRRYKYQKHPDPNQIRFFSHLVRDALGDGVISRDFIRQQINDKHIRPDILRLVEKGDVI